MSEPDRLRATTDFFGDRAATWERRFPDDAPRYERAVGELALSAGATVLDAGCGTGRALPILRAAVGAAATVLGLDVTPGMLVEAAAKDAAYLMRADVLAIPLTAGCLDAVFAAGLISHLPDPAAGLAELARVCRRGARLALFHPIGRAALARRHGRGLDADDIRGEARIRPLLAATGWACESVDDADDRYLVLAVKL